MWVDGVYKGLRGFMRVYVGLEWLFLTFINPHKPT